MHVPIVRRALTGLAIAAVAAVSAAGGVAFANHTFSDVPDETAFGQAINAGSEAGCFTGFNDGTFRPGDTPTRGQFAFWTDNCGARAGAEIDPTSDPVTSSGSAELQSIDVEVGGTGTQQIVLQASLNASNGQTIANACSGGSFCGATFRLVDEGDNTISGTFFFRKQVDVTQQETISFGTVVEATAGVHTYRLLGDPFFLGAFGEIAIQSPTITAVVAPLPAVPFTGE